MKTIGWIGTGVMGLSMARNLMNEGYELHVYTRTKSKAQELLDAGACWHDSPKLLTQNVDIVCSIVGYPQDVFSVYAGDDGVFQGAHEGQIFIDMTTSEPSLAKELHLQAEQLSCAMLDAPVSGGDIGAKNGSLAIMVGGDKLAFNKALPLFKILGKNIAYMGDAGSGQHCKMSNQILIASTMIGVVEALLYAYKAGLPQSEVIAIIGQGAAGSWSINNLGPRIVEGDFEAGFYIEHFLKDMGIALKEAERMNLALPGLALAKQFYTSAVALDLGKKGTQALYLVFQKLTA